MASQALANKAMTAFIDDNFELAIDLYTEALLLEPNNADLFADRAQAYIKLNKFTDAVGDASKAIELDPSMLKAYLRKGTAYMKLKDYRNAKTMLEAGGSLASEDVRFNRLIKECRAHNAEETKVQTAPSCSVSPSVVGSSANDAPPVAAVPKPKYRHSFYNSPTEVVLTIFAKNIPPENISIDFGEQILSVSIDVPGEEAYHLQARLFAKIIPEKCRYIVLSSKIEIRLSKVENITWTTLEYCEKRTISQNQIVSSDQKYLRPSYPSSKGKVDWDKLEAQVKKEEKEEKLDGDAAANKILQEMYKDSNEDIRRAMNKSFFESNGTVLSTNWKDVGSKKVEGSAPDGMEMKKWEY